MCIFSHVLVPGRFFLVRCWLWVIKWGKCSLHPWGGAGCIIFQNVLSRNLVFFLSGIFTFLMRRSFPLWFYQRGSFSFWGLGTWLSEYIMPQGGAGGMCWYFFISVWARTYLTFSFKNIRLKCCVKERETSIERWKLPGPKASLTEWCWGRLYRWRSPVSLKAEPREFKRGTNFANPSQ